MPGEAVGIVVKPGSGLAEDAARRVIKRLEYWGIEPLIEADSAKSYAGFQSYKTFRVDRDPPPKVIVVGGDGTLLRTAMSLSRPQDVVLMAVRAGKRGFLLDVEQYEIEDRVDDFIEGKYVVVEYPRIRPSLGGLRESSTPCAMNDIVFITKMAKLVNLTVYVEGERVYNVDGDGLVVATTVGSTAYSLSAGGPIIDPSLDVHVITPLNPVQLHLRPVVVPPNYLIEIEVRPYSSPLYMSIDGQYLEEPRPGSIVRIERCGSPVKIARFRLREGYYERLLTRLLMYW